MKLPKIAWLLLALVCIFFAFCFGMSRGRGASNGVQRIVTEKGGVSAQERLIGADPPALERPIATEASIIPERSLVAVININTASAEELTYLPGIGQTLAQRIVDYRVTHGSFSCVEELMNVNGIGKSRYEMICNLVTVEESDENTGS